MKKNIIFCFAVCLCIVSVMTFTVSAFENTRDIDVEFETVFVDEYEYSVFGIITAYEKGEQLWKYTTEEVYLQEAANFISDIEINSNSVYIAANQVLYSLDIFTGEIKWTVENIGVSNSISFDKYGNTYISGIYGPNLVVINKKGNVLYREETEDSGYSLVNALYVSGNNLYITYGSSETGAGMKKMNIKQFRPNDIEIILNAESLKFDQPPIIVNNRTFVPVRAVVEAMNGDVNWDGVTQCVTLSHNGDTIKLFINSTTAYLNGEPTILDVPPQAINGRTLLPIRFVAENFGYNVEWNEYSKTIDIYSKSENMIDYELLSCIGKTKSSIEDKYGNITNSEYYLGGKYYMHGNMKTQIFYENDDEYYDYEVHDDATENAECLHMFVKLSELITTDKKIYSIADLEKIFGSYKFINQLDSEEYPMCSYEFSFGDYLIYIESDHLNPQVEYAYIFRNLI